MTDAEFLAARTEHWARTLTAIPSVTGTSGEAEFAPLFAELLKASPAFAGHPDAVWTVAVPGGPYRRACVLGLVRGKGRRTVILTGHFDTVETGCYGDLQPLALTPDRLGPALVEKIAAEPFDQRSARARDDLANGLFMAGRGLLDMKAGLAAGLAVCEAFARLPDRQGNLLFIAVPDEEGNSAGARRMAEALSDIAAERGLDLEAVINLDATGDEGDGEIGRAVALGSVGKLLPSALVVGRAAHASDSFRGFSAGALAGGLAAEVEWLPELTERTGDELGAGPTLLGMKDSKTAYDVTTPATVWMYWNVALHRHTPGDVLAAMTSAAGRAAVDLSAKLRQRAEKAGADVGIREADIMTFEALKTEIVALDPRNAEIIAALAEELEAGGFDLPEQCRRITEHAWALSGRSGPSIVIGFASTPYLAARLGDDPRANRLEAAVRDSADSISQEFSTTIRSIRFFPGISDVSFFGQADDGGVPAIATNTPAWRTVLGGADRFAVAGIPCINVGPWGRDYHTRLERMHIGYGFGIVPNLIQAIVQRLLAEV